MKTGRTRSFSAAALLSALAMLLSFLAGSPVRAQDAASVQAQPRVSIGVSHSFLQLPDTSFLFLMDDTIEENTVFKFENHDGELNGARIDASIDGIAQLGAVALGAKGFYSEVDGNQTIFCDEPQTGQGDCGWMFLVDPNPNANDKNEIDSAFAQTEREARHWGLALEAMQARPGAAALKSGLAFKAIDQSLKMRVVDNDSPAETLDYREDLDTHYWGGYLGFVAEQALFSGIVLRFDGEVGLYYARTGFDGDFLQIDNNQVAGSQNLSLSRDDAAVVAALKVEAERAFGPLVLSLFGQGEWYSYAPEMAYNDADRDPALQIGQVDGTRIDEGSAYALSAGARASLLLGSQSSQVAGWASQGTPPGHMPFRISAGVGHSFLQLPVTSFLLLVDDSPIENTVAKFENHDGELNGTRIDASIDGIAQLGAIALGVKGFYSEVDGSQTVFCDDPQTGLFDCGWMFLFDPDPAVNDKNNIDSTLARADREVQHWGAAIEAKRARPGAVTLKSGLAVKAIDQELTLRAAETNDTPTETLDYREDLDTRYWGGYLGFTAEQALFHAIVLRLDGEVGLYHAETDYQGVFVQVDGASFQRSQALALERDDTAVVAALTLEAERTFGPFMLSLFGQGEWYSYAPEMAYNDTDRAPALQLGQVDGTRIDEGSAYALTAGARISVPLDGILQ